MRVQRQFAETKFVIETKFAKGDMETPERLENCPPTPEEVLEGSSGCLEEARVSKLKLSENSTCVICYSSVKQESFPENCAHIFCFDCLCKWSRQKNQCPLCKKGKVAAIPPLYDSFSTRRDRNFAQILCAISKTNMEVHV